MMNANVLPDPVAALWMLSSVEVMKKGRRTVYYLYCDVLI
jgi:hypothetical protein